MGEVSEKMMSRIYKVLALHRQGVGGEAENAGVLLDRLLKENGLTMADLEEGHEAQEFCFSPKNKQELTILHQIIATVKPDWDLHFFHYKKSRKRGFRLTPAEHAEISVMFSLYRADLKKVIEKAVYAFIQANNIFPPSTGEEVEPPARSPEEEAEIKQMLAMAMYIPKTNIRKQIGEV